LKRGKNARRKILLISEIVRGVREGERERERKA